MMLVTAFVTALHTTYATHNVARPEPEPEPDPFLSLASGLWLLAVKTLIFFIIKPTRAK